MTSHPVPTLSGMSSLRTPDDGYLSAWERLEARAGASDQYRRDWLAERRTGISASEISQLWKRRDKHGSMVKLAREKLSNQEGFQGNVYTQWGVDREVQIALALQREHGFFPETRVFRAVQNPFWFASPDGVAVTPDDEVWVSEIKTSGTDVAVGSKGFDSKRYLAQMVWTMGVLGATQCLYTWEYRHGSPEYGFVVGERQSEWVNFSDHQGLWYDLQEIADTFLTELGRQSSQYRA